MVEASNRKHSQYIRQHTDHQSGWRHAHEEDANAREIDPPVRQAADPVGHVQIADGMTHFYAITPRFIADLVTHGKSVRTDLQRKIGVTWEPGHWKGLGIWLITECESTYPDIRW